MPEYKIEIDSEIWLIGKGPSLDTYDWNLAGPCRVGINEAAYLTPNCYAAIAVDYPVLYRFLGQYLENKNQPALPPEVIVIRKNLHTQFDFPRMYLWKKGREATNLFATAPIVLQVLHYLGARKFHFVGFDSMRPPESGSQNLNVFEYSDNIKSLEAKGTNQNNFIYINHWLKVLIRDLGIEAIWEHTNESDVINNYISKG